MLAMVQLPNNNGDMTGNVPNSGDPKPQLRDDLVLELIRPEIPYRPFGAEEPLAEYLYRPTREAQSADTMIAFVDATEPMLDITDVDNELNQEKLARMMALVADVPIELGEVETLRLWKHVLESDWIFWFAGVRLLQTVLYGLKQDRPNLVEKLYPMMLEIRLEKLRRVREIVDVDEIMDRLGDPIEERREAQLEIIDRLEDEHNALQPIIHAAFIINDAAMTLADG